jgi:hypothetical protein
MVAIKTINIGIKPSDFLRMALQQSRAEDMATAMNPVLHI